MTDEQKLYFAYGAFYAYAQIAKEKGHFKDLNIQQVVYLYLNWDDKNRRYLFDL